MPRLDKRIREEVQGLKGLQSQKEVAEMFGINPSSVSRIWKKTKLDDSSHPNADEAASPDKFDVEVSDLQNREVIEVNVQDGKFLQDMDNMMDGFHQQIEQGAAGEAAAAEVGEIPEMGDVLANAEFSLANIQSQRDIPDDILQTPILAGMDEPVPPKPSGKSELDRLMGSDDVVDEAMKFLQEKEEPKKRGKKRKSVEFAQPTQQPTPPPPPRVEFKSSTNVWTKDMLVARINAYVNTHTELLRPYIGSGKDAPQKFLVNVVKQDRDKLLETYTNLKSLVNFEIQTKTCMVGAVISIQAVEQITAVAGFKTKGLTQDILIDNASRMAVEECCQDYVMDHPQWFNKVNRPEVRFAQIIFGAAQRRHSINLEEERAKLEEDRELLAEEIEEGCEYLRSRLRENSEEGVDDECKEMEDGTIIF